MSWSRSTFALPAIVGLVEFPFSGSSLCPLVADTVEKVSEAAVIGHSGPGPGPVRRSFIFGRTERRWLKDRQPGRDSPHSHQPNARGTPGRYIVSTASMTRPAASIEAVTGRVR